MKITAQQRETLLALEKAANENIMLAKVNTNYHEHGERGALQVIKALLSNADLTCGMIDIDSQINTIKTTIYGI